MEEATLKKVKASDVSYYNPALEGCRSVYDFLNLNRIEEGSYGVVYRAMDKSTHEIVALKYLKVARTDEDFSIHSLREIGTMLKCRHPNIVRLREIVIGSRISKIYIVMEYMDYDLKALMDKMKGKQISFSEQEVRDLLIQLLSAVEYLHENWIIHRDLKTSNLFLTSNGTLKVGDFGLAREFGSPLKKYTPLVVTLWYRAPELLLGCQEYSTEIDIWSVGCIFGELLQMNAVFRGQTELDQLNKIFYMLGTPTDAIWPGFKDLPSVRNATFVCYPHSKLFKYFGTKICYAGYSLLNGLLTYDPKRRFNAKLSLRQAYFATPSPSPTFKEKTEDS